MNHPVKGIDHCYLLVDDLEESAERYRRLGFQLSPLGRHSAHMGTANYTIIFYNDYIELLGIIEDTPLSTIQRQKLENLGQGLHAVAARIDDAEKAKKSLNAFGFNVDNVQKFSRPLQTANGHEETAHFETLDFNISEIPQGRLFMCAHKTPHLIWQNHLSRHQNGALALGGIFIVADHPEETAKRFGRLFQRQKIITNSDHTIMNESLILETGIDSASFYIMSINALKRRFPTLLQTEIAQEHYAGLSIHVDQLEKTKKALDERHVSWAQTPQGSIVVSPQNAAGAFIEFCV
ncbi:VOC family protein [Bartonella tamiae]|uniref:VOC family protein n=1 Tax=Bartonella tamiae TaxID=373638 RepID=UPI00026E8301|nr:VOC family protein [Bartonella tamiae]EJF95459.1 hypothetical protein MEG_00192 [Bartonella tamiae Th307]